MQTLLDLFAGVGLMPHGYCLLWSAPLILLHAGSDIIIAAAYLTIPVMIAAVLRKRQDLNPDRIGYLFAAFILACAATHLMALTTLWFPLYSLQGVVKAICAAVSGATAIVLWQHLPDILAMPGPDERNRRVNELQTKVLRRHAAECELKRPSGNRGGQRRAGNHGGGADRRTGGGEPRA